MPTRHGFRFDSSPLGIAERLKREAAARLGGGGADRTAALLKIVGSELLRHPLLAAGIARLGTRVRERGIGQIARDVQRVAYRHPTLAVIGGLAIGLILARVARMAATSDVVEGAFEPIGDDALVRSEHLTTVSSPERRRQTFGD